MGLQPVTSKKKTKSNNHKKITTKNHNKRPSSVTGKKTKQHSNSFSFLNDTPNIPLQTQLDYARNGSCVLRKVLPSDYLSDIIYPILKEHSINKQNSLDAWRQKVEAASSSKKEAQSCKTIQECKVKLREILNQDVDIPFLQYFNTWRTYESISHLVQSPLLASLAAKLMDVESVRLYQDSVFYKRKNDGVTPWHSDCRMAPFDSSNFITFCKCFICLYLIVAKTMERFIFPLERYILMPPHNLLFFFQGYL